MKNKNMPELVAERAILKLPGIASVTSTELQNNFGKYMDVVEAGGMVMVTKNGRKIMRLVPVREAAKQADNAKKHKYTPVLQAIRDLGIVAPSEAEETKNEYLQRKYSQFNYDEDDA